MELFVVLDEKDDKIYNFKKNEYVSQTELDQNCLLPSIGFAYKTMKYQHLFMKKPSENKLQIKQVEETENGLAIKISKEQKVTSNE